MAVIASICQIVLALGILNVWVLRSGKPTAWRGGEAKTMQEEFAVYGLPGWCMGVVGFLKIVLAILLIAGLWFPSVAKLAALGMAILMLGAVSMHIKVHDPLKKSLPAFSALVLAVIVVVV